MTAKTKPATSAIAITLSDTAAHNPTFRALYVGGAGNLKVTTANGEEVTFSGLVAGTILPIEVEVLWATGSTATLILGLR